MRRTRTRSFTVSAQKYLTKMTLTCSEMIDLNMKLEEECVAEQYKAVGC